MIRAMTPADILPSAALVARSWMRAYADIVPVELQPTAAEHADHLAQPDSRGWVYDLGNRVAAVALVTGTDTPEPELSVLHVDPPAQGAGVGRHLHDAVLDALRAAGHAGCHLWVFAANEHARAFYAARGWHETTASDAPARCSAAPAVRLAFAF